MGHSPKGLYREDFEHDACGIGAVVSIDGLKSHSILDRALCIVEKLEHRAGKDADGETGDGVGILTQIPHVFFKKTASFTQILHTIFYVCFFCLIMLY